MEPCTSMYSNIIGMALGDEDAMEMPAPVVKLGLGVRLFVLVRTLHLLPLLHPNQTP